MSAPFKVGDLVRPASSEWAPPNVNGPYGEWVGLVIGVEAVSSELGRIDWECKLSIPGHGIVKLWDFYLEAA